MSRLILSFAILAAASTTAFAEDSCTSARQDLVNTRHEIVLATDKWADSKNSSSCADASYYSQDLSFQRRLLKLSIGLVQIGCATDKSVQNIQRDIASDEDSLQDAKASCETEMREAANKAPAPVSPPELTVSGTIKCFGGCTNNSSQSSESKPANPSDSHPLPKPHTPTITGREFGDTPPPDTGSGKVIIAK